MRLMICATLLLAACADPNEAAGRQSVIELAGYLESKSLREASGLAHANGSDDLLWAINDDGPPVLYALGLSGEKRGKVRIEDAKNRDWEDLASFMLDGTSYLVVADIGDNEARRKDVTLYIVEEPDPGTDAVEIAWEIEFTYPEGPRDAEALAVDAVAGRILVLSKRDIPARLYSLPLQPESDDRITAAFIGAVSSLPQPNQRDVSNARVDNSWHWQPTGMDIAPSQDAMLILTYRGIYYYSRLGEEAWNTVLERAPLGAPLGEYRNAESIAFAGSGRRAFVTTEKRHAPLLRIDLGGARERATAPQ